VGLLLTRALVCRYRDEVPFGCFGGTTRDRYLYGIYRLRTSWQRRNVGVVGKALDVTTALSPSGLLALQEMEPPEVLPALIRYVDFETLGICKHASTSIPSLCKYCLLRMCC
jgi:hypothetical protein